MILLTGVNGFIGKHIVDELLRIYGVDNVVVLSTTKHPLFKTIVYHDGLYANSLIEDDDYILENVKYVLHVGAFTPKGSAVSSSIFDTQNNIINSTFLFTLPFKRLKKVIFLSTLDVYANEAVIDENTLTKPSTLYGWSKLYCEEVLKELSRYKSIDYQIFRVGHVYGPGEEQYKKIIPLTFQRILMNEKVEIYGTGNELRNFVYIKDVVQVVVDSLQVDLDDKVINIVGESSCSINYIMETILEITETKRKIEYSNLDFRGRDYVFDNTVFVKNCKPVYTPIKKGLIEEWGYIKNKNNESFH